MSELIPLPPLNEQRRIVAKVEELLAKVEACQRRLAKIPVILKRFRQSVLAAACSGRLTADWREEAEDENEWEEETLDTLLSESLANGRSVLTADQGFPVLRLTCLKKGRVDLAERKVGAWTKKDAQSFLIRKRDFLVSRGNGSLSLVGRGGLVDRVPDDVAYPDTLIRVRVNAKKMSPEFLSVLWESKYIRQQVEAVAHTTAGIYKISQKSMERFLLQVPPLSEQHEIVRRVEALFKFADQIEARYEKAQAQVAKLTQSILGKAFRGELVPINS
jgi:type I restriction enzyme S subunit